MNWLTRNWAGLVVGAFIAWAMLTCSGCSTVPRFNHGWLEVRQVSDNCMWQQREYAARVTCKL